MRHCTQSVIPLFYSYQNTPEAREVRVSFERILCESEYLVIYEDETEREAKNLRLSEPLPNYDFLLENDHLYSLAMKYMEMGYSPAIWIDDQDVYGVAHNIAEHELRERF